MPVAGELVGGPECRYLADLFDDGKAEAVMAGVLLPFIKTGEHSYGVQWYRLSGIADTQAAGIQ